MLLTKTLISLGVSLALFLVLYITIFCARYFIERRVALKSSVIKRTLTRLIGSIAAKDKLLAQYKRNLVTKISLAAEYGYDLHRLRLYNYPYYGKSPVGDIITDKDVQTLLSFSKSDVARHRELANYLTSEEATAFYQRDSETYIPTNVRELLLDVEDKFPFFNSKSLSWNNITEWARSLDIEIKSVPRRTGMKNVSALGLVPYSSGEVGKYIFIKANLPETIKLFLLAHEMGHFFMHVQQGLRTDLTAEELASHDVMLYTSYNEGYSSAEHQADNFALMCMFPTPVLAWINSVENPRGNLSVSHILKHREEFPFDLRRNSFTDEQWGLLSKYVAKRASRFNIYKRDHLRLSTLNLETINIKHLEVLLSSVWAGSAVSLVDENGRIEYVSESFANGLGYSAEEIVGKLFLNDLSASKNWAISIGEQLKRQFEKKTSCWAICKYKKKNGALVGSTLQAYPIVNSDGEVIKSIAEVRFGVD